MIIREAEVRDIPAINSLLFQVNMVHYKGRPDLFKKGGRKFTDNDLQKMITEKTEPIFVCEEDGQVVAHAFCCFQVQQGSNILTDVKSLHINDLCVDERFRGKGIGTAVFQYLKNYAKETGCYNLTLNVWSLNKSAYEFYERQGLVPQKVEMETIL